jgi:hypothetical protein
MRVLGMVLSHRSKTGQKSGRQKVCSVQIPQKKNLFTRVEKKVILPSVLLFL